MHGPDGLFDDPRDAIVIAITTAISSVITSTIPVSWRTGNPRIHAHAARLVTTLPPSQEPGQVAIGDAAIGRSSQGRWIFPATSTKSSIRRRQNLATIPGRVRH